MLLRNDFVHHMSYELRSPLTNIIGFALPRGLDRALFLKLAACDWALRIMHYGALCITALW